MGTHIAMGIVVDHQRRRALSQCPSVDREQGEASVGVVWRDRCLDLLPTHRLGGADGQQTMHNVSTGPIMAAHRLANIKLLEGASDTFDVMTRDPQHLANHRDGTVGTSRAVSGRRWGADGRRAGLKAVMHFMLKWTERSVSLGQKQ